MNTEREVKLNQSQQKAIDNIDGPMMVLAGPGTGKTQILAHRVAEILSKTDMNPSNILCLTFTDSASDNMTERICKIIGADGYEVAVHTFHSFSRMVFSRFPDYFYNGANFQPASEIEKLEILNDILRDLPHDNSLSGTRDEIAINLRKVKSAISNVKRKGGLTAEDLRMIAKKNLEFIDYAEAIFKETFKDKMSPKNLHIYKAGYDKILKFEDEENSLAVQIINDFADAINEALETGKTNSVTAFKDEYYNAKLGVMKDRKRSEKISALADVYEKYQAELEKRALQDFDDMIVQLVDKLENSAELRAELQEQYQYILVDEFQDTNDAQLKILFSLADAPDSNIMVVGDDDQAIYSFQGANVNNLREFEHRFPNCKKVQLYENYRSEEKVLTLAEETISGSEIRIKQGFFENMAELTAKKIHEDGEEVEFIEAENEIDEMAWVAENIKNEADSTREIAVIAREHKDLLKLIPYLNAQGINNIEYEQNLDALSSEVVQALEVLARVVVYLGDSAMKKANELMPELLAHPAWQIPAKEIWQLALTTEYNGRWIETIADIAKSKDDGDLAGVFDWLVAMCVKVKNLTLEDALDELFNHCHKEYYFSEENLSKNPQKYVEFLSDLIAIREALRDFSDDKPTLKTFIEFLDLSRKYEQKITTSRSFGNEAKVHLMSAHSAKGLEFDSVYIINGQKNRWLKNKSDGFFPSNLHLQSSGSKDENLRLIYVAITRAKHRLFITTARKVSKKGENLTILPSLGEIKTREVVTKSDPVEKVQIAWNAKFVDVNDDLRDVLAPRLKTYKLNATALNSFTNLEYAGPEAFLLNNLLKFPSAKSPAADYGTAVHETLKTASLAFSKNSAIPTEEEIKSSFKIQLNKMHMLDVDYKYFLKKGYDTLPKFITEFDFNKNQQVEQTFDANIDEMRLTGKLDMIEIDEKTKAIDVVDFKTGDGFEEFNKGKIKSHTYWQQLMFYKLLVEKSVNQPGYKIGKVSLYFVEAKDDEPKSLQIDFARYDEEGFVKLLQSVWQHIMNLDFPDVSEYPKNLKGTLEFENYLIKR